MDCPELWTDIYFASVAWATEMLKRSRDTDLILNFRNAKHRTLYEREKEKIEPLRDALFQMHRIQDIDLNLVTTAELEILFAELEVEAPKLRSLSIKRTSYMPSKGYPSSFTKPQYIFSPKFLCGGAPRLQRLEIVGCCLPWQEGIPNLFSSQLTNLLLIDGDEAKQRPTLTQLLDILTTLPMLQRLELQYTLPSTQNNARSLPHSGRVISLLQLQHFGLKGACLDCVGLLNALSFPLTTTIKIECDPLREWLEGCSALIDSLSKCHGSTLRPQKLFLSHLNNRSTSFCVKMWDNFDPTIETETAHFPCSIQVDMSADPEFTGSHPIENILPVFIDPLDLDSLQVLEVVRACWTESLWCRYFGELPQLSHIRLWNAGAEHLVGVMAPSQAIGTRIQVRSKMCFHSLKSLTLENVQFRGRFNDLDVGKFVDALMLRAEYGAELHELVISDAIEILHKDVALFKEVVASVIWDGVVKDDPEYYDYEDYDHEDYHDGEYDGGEYDDDEDYGDYENYDSIYD